METIERPDPRVGLTERPKLALPMCTIFSSHKDGGQYVLHALDFDLVCADDTADGAIAKIRLAVKEHIEFGLSRGWDDQILFRAPDEFWSQISMDSPVRLLEPIVINDKPVLLAYVQQNAVAAPTT